MKKRCHRCGKTFELGWSGTKGGCDECLKRTRDSSGMYWEAWETSHNLIDLRTGEIFTVTREAAFSEVRNDD